MINTPYLPPMYAADGMVRIPESTFRQLVDTNMELLEALKELLEAYGCDTATKAICPARIAAALAIAKATS